MPGTYTVTLTAFGLGGVGEHLHVQVDSVIVHPNATAYFVLQPTQVVVPPAGVHHLQPERQRHRFQWDFGDGATSAEFNPVHYYQSAGTFDVMLVANNAGTARTRSCSGERVIGEASGRIRFPNAFMPGSSGPTDGTYDPNGFITTTSSPCTKGGEIPAAGVQPLG